MLVELKQLSVYAYIISKTCREMFLPQLYFCHDAVLYLNLKNKELLSLYLIFYKINLPLHL